MNPLNRNEFVIGMAFGILMTFVIGPWSILLAQFTGLLWALGGAGYGRAFRFFGVPLLTFFFTIFHSQFYACIISSLICGATLSVGYGIPSTQPPDNGSTLGRFWYKVFKSNENLTNLFTRGTIYITIALGYIPCLIFRR